ncbi:MAG: cytochrome c peroxidase [Phycisphaerales bacterium]|nr:cytochrome c peroxidase [Phycisphaerales bacterium]
MTNSGFIQMPLMQIPEGFPPISFPEGNEYTYQRWALGKRLFYDPIMSRQNTVSCASCHIAQKAFSDTLAFSFGDNHLIGTSNAPTLTNIAYHPYYTRAGGVPTLEMQVLVPIQEHNEFNTNILDIVDKLKKDSFYAQQARAAYNREIDAFVITRALSNFERSLISGNADYDNYIFQNKKTAMSENAIRGIALFNSARTNCSKCHSGFNFTNYSFENNGIYSNSADSGRMRLTKDESDRDKYKVPTLRNVALTAPYMHDGSYKTLEAVIANYNSGGIIHKNKSELIKPLGLSSEEEKDLIAFLKALTDNTFINNQNFKK